MTTENEKIKDAVTEQLRGDGRLTGSDVHVKMAGRRVILVGTVPSYRTLRAAAEDAQYVRGVSGVDNRIVVRSPDGSGALSDEEVTRRVERAVNRIPHVSIDGLAVEASGNVCTLSGSVDSLWKKLEAEETVWNVEGVTGVNNRISVVPTGDVTDETIAETITAAIDRNACLDSGEVDVTVKDGQVTLTGMVPSWPAYSAADTIAMYTVGVKKVINNLTTGTEETVR